MTKGTIRKLVTDRGFGFIKTEQEEDAFFHRNELLGVEFSCRPAAVKVRPIETQASDDGGDDKGGDDQGGGEDEVQA